MVADSALSTATATVPGSVGTSLEPENPRTGAICTEVGVQGNLLRRRRRAVCPPGNEFPPLLNQLGNNFLFAYPQTGQPIARGHRSQRQKRGIQLATRR